MSRVILVAETGSDIPPELAMKHGIYIVPMHVTFGDKTLDDGSFPPEEVCNYYERTGTLPKTSGSSPEDFAKVFAAIHAKYPDAHILHLAYSAATTVSYQSAFIAAEGLDYVTSLDTKHVCAAQAAITISTAEYLEVHPETTPAQAMAVAEDFSRRARMGFIPNDLEYLRAGGRINNVTYFLGGRLLHLHPLVEVLDGKLMPTKKYRGRIEKVVEQLVREYTVREHLCKDWLWLLHSPRFSPELKQIATDTARDCGFQQVEWLTVHGVITTHSGPGAFCICGFSL